MPRISHLGCGRCGMVMFSVGIFFFFNGFRVQDLQAVSYCVYGPTSCTLEIILTAAITFCCKVNNVYIYM